MMDETKPLLKNSGWSTRAASNSPSSSTTMNFSTTSTNNVRIVENLGLTVPMMVSENFSASKVTCAVCQEMIDIMGKSKQHVIKCEHCNETTPIGSAPAGKMYVRCLCHCLLICSTSSQRIACPRTNCKRVMNLTPSPTARPGSRVPGMCRVTCVHCLDTFLFNVLQNSLARCPHCLLVSSVGPEFAKAKAIFFLALSVILLIIFLVVAYFVYSNQLTHPVYFHFLYGAIIIATLITICKCLYYCGVKVSSIDGPV